MTWLDASTVIQGAGGREGGREGRTQTVLAASQGAIDDGLTHNVGEFRSRGRKNVALVETVGDLGDLGRGGREGGREGGGGGGDMRVVFTGLARTREGRERRREGGREGGRTYLGLGGDDAGLLEHVCHGLGVDLGRGRREGGEGGLAGARDGERGKDG